MITNIKIINSIELIKSKIRDSGVKKEGSGNFGDIYSEAQLIKMFRSANKKLTKEDKILITYVGPVKVEPIEILGKIVVVAESKAILSVGEELENISIWGVGTDNRDASFALGKAITYSKRYFYGKLLDLSSEDLDPENKDVVIRTLKNSLLEKIESGTDKVNAFLTAFKNKFNIEFNINNLSYEDLVKYDNQL